MTEEYSPSHELQPPTILSYVKDIPNLCSLAGLACTLLAIYFCIIGIYSAAMIGMVWAIALDWVDDLIARKKKGRAGEYSTFGGQLDVLIDIVSYGVTPAVLLMSYGEFKPVFLIGAFLTIAAAAIRLSYFSTYGLAGGTKYTGLALDNNSLLLVFVLMFESLFSHETFTIILYCVCLTLAALNVSQIKTPKLSGKPINVLLLGVYTLAVSAFCGWRLCIG